MAPAPGAPLSSAHDELLAALKIFIANIEAYGQGTGSWDNVIIQALALKAWLFEELTLPSPSPTPGPDELTPPDYAPAEITDTTSTPSDQ